MTRLSKQMVQVTANGPIGAACVNNVVCVANHICFYGLKCASPSRSSCVEMTSFHQEILPFGEFYDVAQIPYLPPISMLHQVYGFIIESQITKSKSKNTLLAQCKWFIFWQKQKTQDNIRYNSHKIYY